MKKNKFILIILYSIISCLLLYIAENIYSFHYFITVLQKIIFFVVIPIFLLHLLNYKEPIIWKINKNSFKYGIFFWLLAVIWISVSYLFLRDYIDWWNISNALNEKWVNEKTFIFIFIYIMFWNSLIEELFFRGFIFNIIWKFHKIFAYIFSSLLFSLYHIAIFWTWFSPMIILFGVIWLFLGWLFFSFLYDKTKWIWAAYIFHIIADLVILIIWFIHLFSKV